MNAGDEPHLTQPPTEDNPQAGSLPPTPDPSMQEYYRLQQDLLSILLIATGVVFISVWIFYSLNTASNYLIGAGTGVVYLRMLAKSVEQLGRKKKRLGSIRLLIFIVLIVTATQVKQLQIIPIFLGFMTYKVAVIFYALRTSVSPNAR